MARIEVDPNYNAPTFSRATAATDLFKKEDVQALAAAMSTHDHTTGKGLPMAAGSIPNGTITSAMIADLTIDTADLKDGAVTSVKIADGTIATGDLANSAVTNAKLGTDTARLNLLTNGGFDIWQRGNGPFTATTAYAADRWNLSFVAPATMSVSRDSANADTSSQYCAAVTYVRGAGTGPDVLTQAANDQPQSIRGRTVTFSVRVKCATANAVRLRFNDGVTGVQNGAYHTGGGAYETLTLTYAVAAAPTSLNIAVQFDASCTAYLDNATLVVGSVPADYAPLHPADDLARCLRYYEVLGANSNGSLGTATYQAAGQVFQSTVYFKAPKPVAPTLTKLGVWTVTNCGQPSLAGASLTECNMFATATVLGYMSFFNTAASTSITIEANP